MTLLANFLRKLIGPSTATLVEDLHVRQLDNWIIEPNGSFIHPQCSWTLANGHPCEGVYEGRNFYDQYIQTVDSLYPVWHEIVNEVVGSPIGGIVIGEYQFRCETNGLWYRASFTHFYRIHQGQIVGVHYYMGKVSLQLHQFRQGANLSTLFAFHSLN